MLRVKSFSRQLLNIVCVFLQAVLESKWPDESSNAQENWRRLRHLIRGVSQFKQALKHRSKCSYYSTYTCTDILTYRGLIYTKEL